MPLHVEQDGAGPRLVLLHGFGQTSRCWGPLAPTLADDHKVVRIDAPGHGQSSAVAADLPTTGRLIAAAGGTGTYIGYSMGARLAMHVAVHAPAAVTGLVLIGGTPGIADDAERGARQKRDAELAARIRADGVDAFVNRWLAQPMFAGLPPEGRFVDERRRNTAEGLAGSLDLAGTGAQEPLWDRLHEITVPVLVMAGTDDHRYADIAQRTAEAIGPNATVALVPDAGHSAHLERPAATITAIQHWLRAHRR